MSFSRKFAEIIKRKKTIGLYCWPSLFSTLKSQGFVELKKKKNPFSKQLGTPCFLFHSLKTLEIEHDPESFQVHKERNTLKPKLLFSNLFKLQNNQILHKLC